MNDFMEVTVKITVLVDNNTLIDRYLVGEPGLSFFIEDEDDTRVLFDLGYSDAFLVNARKLGIDLSYLDWLVFSHSHMDHTWGLDSLLRFYSEAAVEDIPHGKPLVIGHPTVFDSRELPPLGELGSLHSQQRLSRHFSLHLTPSPAFLSSSILYLGEIPHRYDFELSGPIGRREIEDGSLPDTIPDDTGLVLRVDEGIVVITGCAHAGVCNTVAHARALAREHWDTDRVVDVIGGFHLQNASGPRLTATAEYLSGVGLEALHACHCTDLAAKIALAGRCPIREVGAGLVLNY